MELFGYTTCKMKRAFIFFGIFICFSLIGQELPINWGPLEPSKGSLIEIMPVRSGDFYTLRYTGGLLGTFRTTLHNQLSCIEDQRIKPITESGIGNVDGGLYFGNQFLIFLSDRANGTMSLYTQQLNDNLGSDTPTELRMNYFDQRVNAKPNFNVLSSQNRNFIVVYYEIPGKRQNRDVYGYTVFDTTFKTIQQGEYALPFDGNMSTINQHHLTNEGAYLLVVTEHKEKNDKFFGKSHENYKALHIYKIQENVLKEYNIDLQNKRIDDILVTSNNQQKVVMTGLYGKGGNAGIEGVFSMSIDLEKDTIENYKYMTFSKDILKESRNDNQMTRYERRLENRGETPQVYSYKLRQMETKEDGSQIGCMEQYYVRKYTSYDTRTGITTTNFYYYYMDIVVFKINPDGNFAWENRIPKSQISLNDFGPYSSFSAFSNEKKLFLLFNDNRKNYNEVGDFNIDDKGVYGFNLSLWKNVVAMTSIDLSSGEMSRRTFFTRKELSAIVIPKMMQVDWKNKEVLLYAINRNREKFGIISFK